MAHSQSELQVITFAKNLCSYVMTITQKSPKQFRFSLVGRMQGYVLEIDQTCRERMERIICRMAEAEEVNEKLKASDQLGWVSWMNSIRQHAEEIVLAELVFN